VIYEIAPLGKNRDAWHSPAAGHFAVDASLEVDPMTCPNCDAPGMGLNTITKRAWLHCANCGLRFYDPRDTLGAELFDGLRAQHHVAILGDGPRSGLIRRGYEITDAAGNQRLLTWIEIGAITEAI
jgi:hypothetical protein